MTGSNAFHNGTHDLRVFRQKNESHGPCKTILRNMGIHLIFRDLAAATVRATSSAVTAREAAAM